MKLAVVDPSLFTFPYDHHLCEALSNAGNDVVLFGRSPRQDESFPQTSYPIDHHFYRVSESLINKRVPRVVGLAIKGAEHVVDMFTLYRKLTRQRPDVIHVQWFPLPFADQHFITMLRRIAPVVFTVHDTNPFNGNPSSRLQMVGWSALLHQSDHLVVHTDFSRDQLMRAGVAMDHISVVPHGVLNAQPAIHAAMPTRQRSEGQKEKVILLFGAIKPYKGVDVLIRAFGLLPAELRSTTRIVIAGKPMMDVEPLRVLALEAGVADRIDWDFRFLPEEELPSLFESVDILAFPYRDIDASGVLMMSLPFGKPIVATNVGGFGGVLEDGTHGFVVPPEDPEAFANGLARVLADPEMAARFGQRIRDLATSTLSWSTIAEQTASVYQKALVSWR